jgi:suppressor of fused protein SUFU
MNVVEHLESFCGPIVEGWQTDPDGKKMPFQIVRLERGPIEGTVTFSTLGLAFHQLSSASSSKLIRHELVMLARSNAIPDNLPVVLQQVAAEAVSRGNAYLRGEVIGPRGRLFPGSDFTALYVAIPVYFPDEFAAVDQVAFAWLIPITTEEAGFVAVNGWPKFEDLLLREDPDLLDMKRRSAVDAKG